MEDTVFAIYSLVFGIFKKSVPTPAAVNVPPIPVKMGFSTSFIEFCSVIKDENIVQRIPIINIENKKIEGRFSLYQSLILAYFICRLSSSLGFIFILWFY